MPRNVKDVSLRKTGALPNGAATTYTGVLDTGVRTAGTDFPESIEVLIEAPAVGAALGDGATVTYNVCAGTGTTPTAVIIGSAIVQTGAGGAGAAATSKRVRLPADVARYVRLQMVKSATGDATGVSASISLVF